MEHLDPPPQYSSGASTSTSRQPTLSIPGLNHLVLENYRIPDSTVSSDRTTVTLYSRRICSDPAILEQFLRDQIALPPRPLIKITTYRLQQLYFDISIDMMHHITASPNMQRNYTYVKFPGADNRGPGHVPELSGKKAVANESNSMDNLKFWVNRFCADSQPVKSITLRRTITNWDTDYLSGRIRTLIASTVPPAQVLDINISFPLQHSTLIIHSWDKPKGLFSSISSFLTEPLSKKYDAVEVVWPYATTPRFLGDEASSVVRRECVLQSEDAFWAEWLPSLKAAMLGGHHGYVTNENRLDAIMAPS